MGTSGTTMPALGRAALAAEDEPGVRRFGGPFWIPLLSSERCCAVPTGRSMCRHCSLRVINFLAPESIGPTTTRLRIDIQGGQAMYDAPCSDADRCRTTQVETPDVR